MQITSQSSMKFSVVAFVRGRKQNFYLPFRTFSRGAFRFVYVEELLRSIFVETSRLLFGRPGALIRLLFWLRRRKEKKETKSVFVEFVTTAITTGVGYKWNVECWSDRKSSCELSSLSSLMQISSRNVRGVRCWYCCMSTYKTIWIRSGWHATTQYVELSWLDDDDDEWEHFNLECRSALFSHLCCRWNRRLDVADLCVNVEFINSVVAGQSDFNLLQFIIRARRRRSFRDVKCENGQFKGIPKR